MLQSNGWDGLLTNLADRLGRRRAVFVGSVIMIIGAILQTTSFDLGKRLRLPYPFP